MTFAEKLKQLCIEKDIRIRELSKRTGIPATTLYSAITNNTEKISLENLRKICTALDVSILVFFEDEPKPRKRRYQKKHYVIDGWEIKKILREAGLIQQDLADKMGVARTGLTLVLNGKKPCTQKMADKIADALDIPIERFAKEVCE